MYHFRHMYGYYKTLAEVLWFAVLVVLPCINGQATQPYKPCPKTSLGPLFISDAADPCTYWLCLAGDAYAFACGTKSDNGVHALWSGRRNPCRLKDMGCKSALPLAQHGSLQEGLLIAQSLDFNVTAALSNSHLSGGKLHCTACDLQTCFEDCISSPACRALDYDHLSLSCYHHAASTACSLAIPISGVDHFSSINCTGVLAPRKATKVTIDKGSDSKTMVVKDLGPRAPLYKDSEPSITHETYSRDTVELSEGKSNSNGNQQFYPQKEMSSSMDKQRQLNQKIALRRNTNSDRGFSRTVVYRGNGQKTQSKAINNADDKTPKVFYRENIREKLGADGSTQANISPPMQAQNQRFPQIMITDANPGPQDQLVPNTEQRGTPPMQQPSTKSRTNDESLGSQKVPKESGKFSVEHSPLQLPKSSHPHFTNTLSKYPDSKWYPAGSQSPTISASKILGIPFGASRSKIFEALLGQADLPVGSGVTDPSTSFNFKDTQGPNYQSKSYLSNIVQTDKILQALLSRRNTKEMLETQHKESSDTEENSEYTASAASPLSPAFAGTGGKNHARKTDFPTSLNTDFLSTDILLQARLIDPTTPPEVLPILQPATVSPIPHIPISTTQSSPPQTTTPDTVYRAISPPADYQIFYQSLQDEYEDEDEDEVEDVEVTTSLFEIPTTMNSPILTTEQALQPIITEQALQPIITEQALPSIVTDNLLLSSIESTNEWHDILALPEQATVTSSVDPISTDTNHGAVFETSTDRPNQSTPGYIPPSTSPHIFITSSSSPAIAPTTTQLSIGPTGSAPPAPRLRSTTLAPPFSTTQTSETASTTLASETASSSTVETHEFSRDQLDGLPRNVRTDIDPGSYYPTTTIEPEPQSDLPLDIANLLQLLRGSALPSQQNQFSASDEAALRSILYNNQNHDTSTVPTTISPSNSGVDASVIDRLTSEILVESESDQVESRSASDSVIKNEEIRPSQFGTGTLPSESTNVASITPALPPLQIPSTTEETLPASTRAGSPLDNPGPSDLTIEDQTTLPPQIRSTTYDSSSLITTSSLSSSGSSLNPRELEITRKDSTPMEHFKPHENTSPWLEDDAIVPEQNGLEKAQVDTTITNPHGIAKPSSQNVDDSIGNLNGRQHLKTLKQEAEPGNAILETSSLPPIAFVTTPYVNIMKLLRLALRRKQLNQETTTTTPMPPAGPERTINLLGSYPGTSDSTKKPFDIDSNIDTSGRDKDHSQGIESVNVEPSNGNPYFINDGRREDDQTEDEPGGTDIDDEHPQPEPAETDSVTHSSVSHSSVYDSMENTHAQFHQFASPTIPAKQGFPNNFIEPSNADHFKSDAYSNPNDDNGFQTSRFDKALSAPEVHELEKQSSNNGFEREASDDTMLLSQTSLPPELATSTDRHFSQLYPKPQEDSSKQVDVGLPEFIKSLYESNPTNTMIETSTLPALDTTVHTMHAQEEKLTQTRMPHQTLPSVQDVQRTNWNEEQQSVVHNQELRPDPTAKDLAWTQRSNNSKSKSGMTINPLIPKQKINKVQGEQGGNILVDWNSQTDMPSSDQSQSVVTLLSNLKTTKDIQSLLSSLNIIKDISPTDNPELTTATSPSPVVSPTIHNYRRNRTIPFRNFENVVVNETTAGYRSLHVLARQQLQTKRPAPQGMFNAKNSPGPTVIPARWHAHPGYFISGAATGEPVQSGDQCFQRCHHRGPAQCMAVDFDSETGSCWFHTALTMCKPLESNIHIYHAKLINCDI